MRSFLTPSNFFLQKLLDKLGKFGKISPSQIGIAGNVFLRSQINAKMFAMKKGRIEINPKIMVGKPVIAGTRIPVYLVVNLVANGYDFERIIKAYPILTKEDIKAALRYAEGILKREEIYPLPLKFKSQVGIIILRLRDQTVESVNEILERFLRRKIIEKQKLEKSLIVIDEAEFRVY